MNKLCQFFILATVDSDSENVKKQDYLLWDDFLSFGIAEIWKPYDFFLKNLHIVHLSDSVVYIFSYIVQEFPFFYPC